MGVTFNIKVRHFDRSSTTHKAKGTEKKKIATIIGQRLVENVVSVVAESALLSVREFNNWAVIKTALFFNRVVSRTPIDEKYYGHTPDTDSVWKQWKIKYWGKELSAAEIGLSHFIDTKANFDNQYAVWEIKTAIIDKLFKGAANFEKRTRRIRNIRVENDHPRFAMLEYGTYTRKNSETIKEGRFRFHGIQNGYSVQAPYGMLRITEAEMASMTNDDFRKWLMFEQKGEEVTKRTPSKEQMKKLMKIMTQNGIPKRHLSNRDVNAIGQVFEKAGDY